MPKTNNTVSLDLGVVTARDPTTLKPGELSQGVAIEYRPGVPYPLKQPGRSDTGRNPGATASTRAIQHVQYDTGTDKLVAISGPSISEALPAADPGAFAIVGGITLDTTAVPHFSCLKDRWIMCDAVDFNYIREPATVNKAGWASGAWRRLGMQAPANYLPVPALTVLAGSPPVAPVSGAGTYIFPDNARDSGTTYLQTYSYAAVSATDTTKTQNWTFNATAGTLLASTIVTGRSLNIMHAGAAGGFNPPTRQHFLGRTDHGDSKIGPNVTSKFIHLVEYTLNGNAGSPTWNALPARSGVYPIVMHVITLTNGVAYANNDIQFRVTTTYEAGEGLMGGRVYDIRAMAGSTTARQITYGIQYCVSERYIDSDKVTHESNPSSPSITTGPQANVYAISFALPTAPVNAFTTEYVIYRSIDEASGGYPAMWEIDTVPVGSTTYIDTFTRSLNTTDDKQNILPLLNVLLPTQEVAPYFINDPPPKAKMALEFQGSMVYVPVDVPRRLYYSIPAAVSAQAIEQVPAIYYLEFTSPRNDTIVAIGKANGGKSLIVYFESYAMLVSYLPQASDPGAFDNRVKEYVTQARGAAGRLCTTEFSMPTGQTLVAAVDSLGLWITDGVSTVQDWSRDLAWTTHMSGVTLSDGILVDNQEMRRLEFIYLNGNQWYEFHFFYGRVKSDIDNNPAPLISGPHPMGTRCKHYSIVGGSRIGWSGKATANGNIYLERQGTADAANGYDGSGSIPFQVTPAEAYVAGLGTAVLIRSVYPKFEVQSAQKVVTCTGTFTRDGGLVGPVAQTVTKSFTIGLDRKLYLQRYADRFKLQFSDISNTALPGLIAFEYELRPMGEGRDR